MSEEATFSIVFGALTESIGIQLGKQGIALPEKKDIERFDKIAYSITFLHLQGIIPDSVRDNGRKKLMKMISKSVHKNTGSGSG